MLVAEPTSPYYLSRNAFVSLGERHCIVLDLDNDSYLAIPRDVAEALGPWLQGWNELADKRRPIPMLSMPLDVATLVQQLLDRGLITTDATDGKAVTLPEVEQPIATLVEDQRRYASAKYAIQFLISASMAHFQLKHRSMKDIVHWVRDTKARDARSQVVGIEDMARLVSVFNSLRPMFPRDYLCLFDSLALLHFLVHYGVHPQWVFGVRADPFGAHCWLQENNVILNDTPDVICAYTPIMTV